MGSWPIPALFKLIEQRGQIPLTEMARVFNLGIGMIIIADPANLSMTQSSLAEPSWLIGEVVPGEKMVTLK